MIFWTYPGACSVVDGFRVAKGFSAQKSADARRYSYFLRGISIHNNSHNLHLILALNYAYIFPFVGTSFRYRRCVGRHWRSFRACCGSSKASCT